MVRVGGSQGATPGFAGTGQLNQLNQLAAGGYPGFPPGLALAGFNPAAFLQSSTYLLFFIVMNFVETFLLATELLNNVSFWTKIVCINIICAHTILMNYKSNFINIMFI